MRSKAPSPPAQRDLPVQSKAEGRDSSDSFGMHHVGRTDEIAARAFFFFLTPFGKSMQKPNYQFEKRRREMDKKAKKEEKRRQKLEAARSAPAANDAATPAAPSDPA